LFSIWVDHGSHFLKSTRRGTAFTNKKSRPLRQVIALENDFSGTRRSLLSQAFDLQDGHHSRIPSSPCLPKAQSGQLIIDISAGISQAQQRPTLTLPKNFN
jgi:hypothetical protein